MSKFRTSILIVGMLVIIVAASLLTVLALYITGAVVTERIELVYSVYDEEKFYDGTPLCADRYELVSGEMLKGHYAVVDFVGSQVDAGESKSSLMVKICDENGFDVTREYKIGVKSGNLKIMPRPISVVLNDEEVTYNGTKVSFEDYTVTEGELVTGHKIAGSQNVQLISVNDALPSDLQAVVFDAVGQDVTKNYEVKFTMGRIRVVPRPVTVKPKDVIKIYDGADVKVGDVEVLSGSLAEGQYFKNVEINNNMTKFTPDVCDITTSITKLAIYQRVGTKEVDVTENYDIDRSETGVVRIDKRPLTISAKSKTWEYDGGDHDLSSDHSPLSYEGLAPGEQLLSVDYSGSIKNAGSTENRILSARIYSTVYDSDVSLDNYEIKEITGTLTVTPRNITIITPTVTEEYDGTAHKGVSAEHEPTGVNLLSEHVLAPVEESVPELTDCDTVVNEYKCRIVDKNDLSEIDLSNFNIIYYYGKLSVTPRTVYVTTPEISTPFNGEKHYAYESADEIETDNLATGHKIVAPEGENIPYHVNVTQGYNIFEIAINDANEKDVTKNYDIKYNYGVFEITYLNLVFKTDGETREYDGTKLQKNEEYTDFGELPASLTAVLIGEAYPEITNVSRVENKVVYKLTKDGADVDGDNYHIDYDYGWLEITPCIIDLKLNDKSKDYDGKAVELDLDDALSGNTIAPFTTEDFVIGLPEDKDAGSYTYTVTFKKDEPNYILNTSGGNITIKKLIYTIELPEWKAATETEAAKEEYFYTGLSRLPQKEYAIRTTNLKNGLLTYDDFTMVSESGDIINASDELYYYTAQLNPEKEKNFEITFKGGSLKVRKCVVNITLKDYDGMPYTAKVQEPKLGDAEIESELQEVNDSPAKYLELYHSVIKNAGTHYYGIRLINAEDENNFNLIIENDIESVGKFGKYVITKVEAGIINQVDWSLTKDYDGKVYTADTTSLIKRELIRLNKKLDFEYTMTLDCVTNDSEAKTYKISINDNLHFFADGEEITQNIKFGNEEEIILEIKPRDITFKFDNYFCAAGTDVRSNSPELFNCLVVSSLTPLLPGYSVNFDDIYISVSADGKTFTTYDIDLFVIKNEEGVDVTHNFNITNLNDGYMTGSIIYL